MRNAFRRLLEAVDRLSAALREVAASYREMGPAAERLEALELAHYKWEADVEATLQKAEGKLQAASNAEARTRTMKRAYEKFADPFDPDFEEEPEAVRADDVAPGPEEGLPPVRLDVAPNDKTRAMNAKFA